MLQGRRDYWIFSAIYYISVIPHIQKMDNKKLITILAAQYIIKKMEDNCPACDISGKEKK